MNNSNIEIYFPNDDIFNIISNILRKNGLYENPIDIADKDDSLIIFVLSLTKNFAKEKISEKDLIDSLQKKLNVSPEIAKNIVQGIKEMVLPQAEKVTIGVRTQEKKSTEKKDMDIFPKVELPTNAFEQIEKNIPPKIEESISGVAAPPKKQRVKKPIISEEINEIVSQQPRPQPQSMQKRGPDSYREPIE